MNDEYFSKSYEIFITQEKLWILKHIFFFQPAKLLYFTLTTIFLPFATMKF